MPRTESPSVRPSTPAADHRSHNILVAAVNAALDGDPPTSALLRLSGDPLQIGYLTVDDGDLLDSLVGFTAPPNWLGIGVYCSGRAYPITPIAFGDDGAAALADRYGINGPTPVVVTAVVDRQGGGAVLLRHGSSSTWFHDTPEGMLGDACLRALGLPTPPPPRSTAELWLRMWLDRVTRTAASAGMSRPPTWGEIAALHPAAPHRHNPLLGWADPLPLDDPFALAESTLALAETWTWARVQREPELIDVGRPPFTRELAGWMDEGMLARALLGELAPLHLQLSRLQDALPRPLAADIETAVLATGLRQPVPKEVVR